MHNYKELNIWKDSFALTKQIYSLTNNFPKNENYGLRSQMTRCAVSIPSNIAEGSSRSSDKDFARFLEIAMGSSFELETQLELAKEIFNTDKIVIEELIIKLNKNQKMLRGLISKLRKT